MPRRLVLVVIVFYALHQDLWFWRTATPLVFGIMPIGLFYHAAYTLAVSLLVWVLIRAAWPAHLEHEGQPSAPVPDPASRAE